MIAHDDAELIKIHVLENGIRYKWNPKKYANHSAEQQKWAEELLSKLSLKGNEKVLDIGCGDGKITAWIAQLLPVGSVLGIDNSKQEPEGVR